MGEAADLVEKALAHERAGRTADARQSYVEAEAAARAAGDLRTAVDALVAEARLLHHEGDQDAATARLQEALGRAHEIGHTRGAADAIVVAARIHRFCGRREESATCLREALTDYAARAGRVWAARATHALAGVLFELGRHEEAAERGEQAADLLREIGDMTDLAVLLPSVALAYCEVGRLSQAWGTIEEACFVADGCPDSSKRVRARAMRAFVLRSLGRFDEALEAARSLLAASEAAGLFDRLFIRIELATTHAIRGDVEDAREQLAEIDRGEWGAYRNLLAGSRLRLEARLARLSGDTDRASVLLRRALAAEETNGVVSEAFGTRLALSRVLEGPAALAEARAAEEGLSRSHSALHSAVALRRIAELTSDESERAAAAAEAFRRVDQIAAFCGPHRSSFLAREECQYVRSRTEGA